MTRGRRRGTGAQIFLLILSIIALFFGGLIWFDYLGLVDAKKTLAPVYRLLGRAIPSTVDEPVSPDLLEQERLVKMMEEIDLRQEELDKREIELADAENEVEQKKNELENREKELEEKENSFNQNVKKYENKNANLRRRAADLLSMPPANVVAILDNLEDQDVIDLLRTVQELSEERGALSPVPGWFMQMDEQRAAVLTRKMIKKPQQDS